MAAGLINNSIHHIIFSSNVEPASQDSDIRDDEASEVNLGVINMMPELKWYATLPFTQHPPRFDLADDAASICGHLSGALREIKLRCSDKSVYANYQITLRRVRRKSLLCQLSLRVDGSEWYDLGKERDENIEEQAYDYIIRVNEEHEDDEFRSYPKPVKDNYKYLEDLWACTKKVLVNGPEAWKAVLTVLDHIQKELELNELPFYKIYVNFGKWHSQIHSGCSDGHAHINIVLTPAAIEACKNSSNKFSCLSNSNFRPPDYRLDNANKLAQELKKSMGGNLSITDKLGEEATS